MSDVISRRLFHFHLSEGKRRVYLFQSQTIYKRDVKRFKYLVYKSDYNSVRISQCTLLDACKIIHKVTKILSNRFLLVHCTLT